MPRSPDLAILVLTTTTTTTTTDGQTDYFTPCCACARGVIMAGAAQCIVSFPGPTEEERAWYTLFAHAPHHHGNTSRGHRPITGLVGSKVGNYEIPVRAIASSPGHTHFQCYTQKGGRPGKRSHVGFEV